MEKIKLEGKLRVAAYCRVATGSEGSLDCCAVQKAYYTQKIKENPDWELADVFTDEGLGVTDMKRRQGFNRMIVACKRGKIDLILTKSLSRFARNVMDGLEIVRMLKGLGVDIIFEKENINTLDDSSDYLMSLLGSFTQAESEHLTPNLIYPIGVIRTAY